MFNKSFVDKRIERTKELLQDALVKLLKIKKLNNISITEITNEANVNRGSFYNNYECKEDILIEMMDKIMKELIYSYRYPYKDSKHFMVEELATPTIKIFEHVERHQEFYQLIMKTNLFNFKNQLSDQIKRLILVDVSIENPNLNLNVEFKARFIAEGIKGLIFEWVQKDFKYSSIYMDEQLIEIISDTPNKVYLINNKVRK